MPLYRVTLTTEIVVIAKDEADALVQAQKCQKDVADNAEFEAENPVPIRSNYDKLPPYWNKNAIPWNGKSATIYDILNRD